MMFIKPGLLINDYLKEKTRIYINPLKYLIIIGGIFAFVMLKTNIIDISYQKGNELIFNSTEELNKEYADMQKNEAVLQMQQNVLSTTKKYINIVPLFVIPFYSFVGLWFYLSRRLFYGEFLIISSFVIAQTFLISILFLIPLVYIYPVLTQYFPLISFIASCSFLSYALHKTFKESPLLSILKGFLIYILGTIVFWIALIMLFFIRAIILELLGINLIDLFT